MNTLKKSALVAMVIIFSLSINSTGWAEEESPFSGSIGIVFADKYLSDSGINASAGKAIYQPDFYLAYDSRFGLFSLELWGSFQFEGTFRDEYANEIDYIISWQKNFKWALIQIGFDYIDCAQLLGNKEGDVAEWIIDVNHEFSLGENGDTLTPYIRLEWNELIGMGDTSSNLLMGLVHGHAINEDFFLSNKIAIIFDDGKDTDAGTIGLFQTTLSYALRENLSLDLMGKITSPLIDADDRDTEWLMASGITWTF
ncbi:MAG: hypothetical protein RBS77_01105 [Candidatus Moranbacteria bacterium]|jgi:hypothetical protein|nr:hypothetical protein [Candidatus Moranbacteria bacterium]